MMNEKEVDWTRFIKQLYIKASASTLFPLWSTQNGLESWFLKQAIFVDSNGSDRSPIEQARVGDTYKWMWHNWEFEEQGQIMKVIDSQEIEFEFADSIVNVSLHEEGMRTLVKLEQYHIKTDEQTRLNVYYGCGTGWTFWLTNLKAWVEHGILLNEKDPVPHSKEVALHYVNI